MVAVDTQLRDLTARSTMAASSSGIVISLVDAKLDYK